ncbi:MAG TPA: hypothetical protein VGO92_02625 [Acidimicrobiales bacterium]|jgi:hypothetical protein|nr:hypothetical protein [Acidimicrobiales bacterium]
MRRLLVALAMVGWGLAAPDVAHAEPEPAACTAFGAFAYAPGLTVVPGPQAVTGTLTLNCPVLGDDAGIWTLFFAGPSPLESCEAGVGTMAWVWPSAGPAPEGVVGPGGGFTYVRVGIHMDLAGTIPTLGPPVENHTFTADLFVIALPAGSCLAPPTPGLTVGGVALLSDL